MFAIQTKLEGRATLFTICVAGSIDGITRMREQIPNPQQCKIIETKKESPCSSAIKTAFDWHNGSGSAFYRFATWGGLVFGEKHREDLYQEIRSILPGITNNVRESVRLRMLKEFVDTVPLANHEGIEECL